MDSTKFDKLAKTLASGASRRTILKTMLGGRRSLPAGSSIGVRPWPLPRALLKTTPVRASKSAVKV